MPVDPSEKQKPRMSHVPIFPPSIHAALQVEKSGKPATARFQGAMDDARTPDREIEDADPERWDGLS